MLKLYRRRLIPDELISLDKDSLLFQNDELLITGWKAIRKRSDLDHGYSIYYLKEGWKISRFYEADGSLKFTYCDIVRYEREGDSLTCVDLLADVTIEPGGQIRILDLDELAQAFDRGLITKSELILSLKCLDSLLEKLYSGGLTELEAPLLPFLREEDPS